MLKEKRLVGVWWRGFVWGIFLTGALGDSCPPKVTKHLHRLKKHSFVQLLRDAVKNTTVD